MQQLRGVIRRARMRLSIQRILHTSATVLLVLGVVVFLAILSDKLFFIGRPLSYFLYGAAGVALACIVTQAMRRRPGLHLAAVEIDDRLGLAERISSANAVAHMDDPMSRAVVDDASAYVRNISIPKAFPLHLPRRSWGVAGLAAAIIALLYFMPQLDLLARQERFVRRQKEKELVRVQAEAVKQRLKQMREALPETTPEIIKKTMAEMDELVAEMEKGDISKAEAMAKFARLDDQLKEAQSKLGGERDPLQAKKQEGRAGEAGGLSEALAEQDFARAKSEMEKLAKKAEQGELTEEERKEIADAVKKMAQQMKNRGCLNPGMCDAMSDLANQLAEANMNPQALKQALQQCKVEFDEAADLQAVLKQCQGLCQNAGKGLAKNKPNWVQGPPGVYSKGDSRTPGPGMGGPGVGKGNIATADPEPVTLNPELLQGEMQAGRMLGSFFVDGKQIKGEATAEFQELKSAAESTAEEAIGKEEVPQAYREFVRDYFHDMKTK